MPVWSLKSTRTDRGRVLSALAALTLLLCAAAGAQPRLGSGGGLGSQSEFLPEEEAFRWHVSRPDDERLTITWEIAPAYYLYREQFHFSLDGDTTPLDIALPDGQSHHDAYFGDVEVYYNGVRATITLPDSIPAGTELRFRYQGCAEAGLCYPPQQRSIPLEP